MPAPKWSGVQMHIGTLGAEQTISSITKANPGVATYVGTDPTSGDYVALVNIQGMHQVNNRAFRAADVDGEANTLKLEGENTTAYDTFASGKLKPISWSASLSVVRNLSGSGGDFDFEDDSTVHDLQRTEVPNQSNPLRYTLECKWDIADSGLLLMNQGTKTQELLAVRFSFLNGYKVVFLGYAAASLAPVGERGQTVTTPVAIAAYGALTFYTT